MILKTIYLTASGIMKMCSSMIILILIQTANNYHYIVGIFIFILTLIWVFYPYYEEFKEEKK